MVSFVAAPGDLLTSGFYDVYSNVGLDRSNGVGLGCEGKNLASVREDFRHRVPSPEA
jgi:hypothetical protein